MNITIALNQKYYYYTYVMLTSLFENNREESMDLYVLNTDLTTESLQNFSQLGDGYQARVHDIKVNRSIFPAECPTTEQWTIETYFRLALVDLLPDTVDRILYIDVDTIVNGSLGEMYHKPFEGAVLYACRDDAGIDEIRQELFRDRIAAGYSYFNAGVMLLNMDELRKGYDLSFYVRKLQELKFRVCAPDQDLLNLVHWQRVRYFEGESDPLINRHNLYARTAYQRGYSYEWAEEHALIIHYISSKPWDTDNSHFYMEKIWWEYAKKTPYYRELRKQFMDKTLNQKELEQYVMAIMESNKQLQDNISKSLEYNQSLLAHLM